MTTDFVTNLVGAHVEVFNGVGIKKGDGVVRLVSVRADDIVFMIERDNYELQAFSFYDSTIKAIPKTEALNTPKAQRMIQELREARALLNRIQRARTNFSYDPGGPNNATEGLIIIEGWIDSYNKTHNR